MTGALALLEHASLVALGWLVILSLFATTLLALALAAWRLRRPSASAPDQYRAALCAFASAAVLGLLALPLSLVALAVGGPVTEPRVTSLTAPPGATAPRAPSGPGHMAFPPAVSHDDGSDQQAPAYLSPSALGLVGGVWMLGATMLVGRLLLAWAAANRLRRRATLMDEGPLRATFERLSKGAHVEGTSLAVSAEVDAPVAVGIRAPAVLVPAHLLEYMPDEGLAPILVHELTHSTT